MNFGKKIIGIVNHNRQPSCEFIHNINKNKKK